MWCDKVVNSFMESIQTPFLTSVSKAIAPIFDPVVLIVLSLLIAPYVYMKSSKKKGILFGGVMFLTAIIIYVAKETITRARPANALMQELTYSFPSGHATISVVFFGLLIYLFVKGKCRIKASIFASILILIIGASRVYLRVHWLSDVLAGFFLGGLILGISIFTFEKLK